MTNVSLFANATRFPASKARSVGTKPTAPTVAETTVSAFSWVATATKPSSPTRILGILNFEF
jgi:hypothetical protein